MIAQETLKKLAVVLGVEVSALEAKIKSEEEETLEVPVLFTEDDKNTYGENRFKEGKKAATEIAVKDLKVKHGLEFDGKSLDGALEAYANKMLADAKIAPDEKVRKLTEENGRLKTDLQKALENETNIKSDYEGKLFHVGVRSQVLTQIPDNTLIPKEDLLDLFMNRHRVVKEDGSTIIYKGEQALKDNIQNPIPLKDVVAQFSEPYLKKAGMGGGDNGGGAGGTFKTISDVYAHLTEKGIAPMSEEGLKAVAEAKKANPALDFSK